jgi:cyclopropane-fatty-acyl-phospholipid synthase
VEQPEACANAQHNIKPQRTTWRDSVIARGLERTFAAGTLGCLDVTLPSGHHVRLGRDETAAARVIVNSHKVLWRLATRGSLGLAESYMRQEIDTPELGAVLNFCLENYKALEGSGSGVTKPGLSDLVWHKRRDNTRTGSRRNIAAHYDLGNDFYAQWLDDGMTYSSAKFSKPDVSLEAAQDEKYRVILDQLNINPGDRVLEIGFGWGGLAERAIARGAHVTGLTLSQQQLAFTQDRLRLAGKTEQTNLRFQDYRDTNGTFDSIVSVEMIEAVGEAHWPQYFGTLANCLKPGGVAVVQAITIDERYFESYRRQADFIQRYIFPGGMLPTVTRMDAEAKTAGLAFETVERFGSSYALTLDAWRGRFRTRWPEIKALGFDERFRRMWDYYLTYCELGFKNGDIDVGIYKMTKPLA